jgi:MFS family permease
VPAARALAVLREHRIFRIYFVGQAISLVGLWMQQVAQSWVIVSLTGNPGAVASVSFVASLPILLLSMQGGVVADRYERRKILIVTQLAMAALAFSYALLVGSGRLTMPILYALVVGLGVVAAFDLPAMQALVPDLVAKEAIPDAIALNQSLMHGTRILGPALAGALMAVTSVAMAFVANGVSYFAVVWSLAVIRVPPRPPRPKKPGSGGLGEGIRYVLHNRLPGTLVGFTALTTMLVFPVLIVFLAIFVKAHLHGDAGALGLIFSMSGVGAMGGALLLLAVPAPLRGRTMIVATLASAGALLLFSTMHVVWAAALVQLLLALCVAVAIGLGTTLLQVVVPPDLRGRVMGIYGLMWTGLMPSAALVLGGIANLIGLRLTMHLMAAAYALLAVPWLLGAGLWKKEIHAAHTE